MILSIFCLLQSFGDSLHLVNSWAYFLSFSCSFSAFYLMDLLLAKDYYSSLLVLHLVPVFPFIIFISDLIFYRLFPSILSVVFFLCSCPSVVCQFLFQSNFLLVDSPSHGIFSLTGTWFTDQQSPIQRWRQRPTRKQKDDEPKD